MDDKQATDILGLAPYGEAVKVATEKTLDGVGAFLGRICLPAAEEFGLLLKDKVSAWRQPNLLQIIEETQRIQSEQPETADFHAHPRIVHEIVEMGSWVDDAGLQKMWAGLLASSCSLGGQDQSNVMFCSVLNQFTPVQARVLIYGCEHAKIYKTSIGVIMPDDADVDLDNLRDICGVADMHSIDMELDRLRDLGVLGGLSGISSIDRKANLNPTAFGLELYLRCKGIRVGVMEHFKPTENWPHETL